MKQFMCNDKTTVSTKAGKLRGYFFDGSYIFKGVHYAEADRFEKPRDVEPWEGVKDATSFGFVCPLMGKETPSGELLVPHAYWPQDEHCQNLNVWTTDLCPEAKKPVMVWLHGGGYSAGSSIEQVCYDGANMAKLGDVVVVTLNHRLNIIGYLDLSDFGEEYDNTGNLGHMDMVAALKWVHENIASFGGDPENVTIFGQSGGGMKVTDLMNIPAADAYFQKGICISGAIEPGIMPAGEGGGRPLVEAMLKYLGLDVSQVAELKTIPYTTLVEAYNAAVPEMRAKNLYTGQRPFVNDWFLGRLEEAGLSEHAKKVPLMIGTVFGEFAFAPQTYNKYELTEEEVQQKLTEKYGDNAEKLSELFKEAYPEKLPIDLLTIDGMFRRPTKAVIQAKAACQDSPTYAYLFNFEFPVENGKLAWHCSDLPFFFHNIDLVPSANVPGVSDKLQEQLFTAVMNFAKCGDPNHAEIPFWPASKAGDEATMIFDRNCVVRHNHDDELLALHKKAGVRISFENAQH
ncbi:MAG: carboxylesterase/lipase family protein [Lachnospiraceae bacterium]|nr:carboxylesterase/lipase family protein [Lachnospiraceae bacterium]